MYAVDDWTLLLVDFNYDGTGDDTFFWAGDSGRPGPLGFIVPDQHGKLVLSISLFKVISIISNTIYLFISFGIYCCIKILYLKLRKTLRFRILFNLANDGLLTLGFNYCDDCNMSRQK